MGFGMERGDALRIQLWTRDDGNCGICLRPINLADLMNRVLVNIDHIRPRAHGGTSRIENLQVAHEKCNTAKGDSCPGCEVCTAERFSNTRRVTAWRAQRHLCHKCHQTILPSSVNDPGKVVANINNGTLRLSHNACEPASGGSIGYNNDMINALTGVIVQKGHR